MGHSHDQNNQSSHGGRGSNRHWMMMVGCLLLPILLFLIFRGKDGGWSNWAWFLVLGGCLLMHAGMMSGGGSRSHASLPPTHGKHNTDGEGKADARDIPDQTKHTHS